MEQFKQKILNYFNLREDDYLTLAQPVMKSDLPDPTYYDNVNQFMARIKRALKDEEKIVIYADYDADGILAASILKYAFEKLDKEVFVMIPSRYKDGYGLNPRVVEKFKARDISLIITVDNGVSAHSAINLANELGIDVLVSDHHEIGESLPEAVAILHPHLNKEDNRLNSCGAFMALIISYGLLGIYDDYLISLASIATIADMMPLLGVNRTLVKLGLQLMNDNHYQSLKRLNDQSIYDSQSVAFKIAPKINALGRLSQNYEASILIEYFLTTDEKRLDTIFQYILSIYEKRKIASTSDDLNEEDLKAAAIIQVSDELEGVLGLLAQNYVTKYNKPAFVFTQSSEDDTLYKGSVRSRAGFNVLEAFNAAEDVILVSGGHAEAGGLTIKKSSFPRFKALIDAFARENPLVEAEEAAISVTLEEITPQNYAFLKALAPFGFGFKAPYFLITDAFNMVPNFSRDGKHLLLNSENGVKYVGFHLGEEVRTRSSYAFYGYFSESEFRGKRTIDFNVRSLK